MKNRWTRKIAAFLTALLLCAWCFPMASLAAPIELYVFGGGGGGGGEGGTPGAMDGAAGGGGGGGYIGGTLPAAMGGDGGSRGASPGRGGVSGTQGQTVLDTSRTTGGAGGLGDNSGLGATAIVQDGLPGADVPSGDSDGGVGGAGGNASYQPASGSFPYNWIGVVGGGGGTQSPMGMNGGLGGRGGDATLTFHGTLSPERFIVMNGPNVWAVNASAAAGLGTATVDTLVVRDIGTMIGSSGTFTLGTIRFDPTSTSLDIVQPAPVPGILTVANVRLTPPASANSGASDFWATGFSMGQLQLDITHLNPNPAPGHSILLLETNDGVPASWAGVVAGNYITAISGNNLLLNARAASPSSSLPRTGDAFPLGGGLATLGLLLGAALAVGFRLRAGRREA